MTKVPLITVIVPTYNRCRLLERAINSVLSQTWRNWELIIVDDASTDDTSGITQRFNDPRIKYLRHDHNQGGAVARNTGIRNAAGAFISFIDDDDAIDPLKLEKQMEVFENVSMDVGVVYCGWRYLYQGQVISKYDPPFHGDVFKQMLRHCFTVTNALLIRKECFQQAGVFDPLLRGCQDWDLWIRLARVYQFEYVPENLAIVHVHGDSQISSNLADKISAREKILKKYEQDLQEDARAWSAHAGRLGILFYLHGEKKWGQQRVFSAVLKDVLFWKNYVYLLLIFIDRFCPGTVEKYVTVRYGDARLYY